MITTHELFDFDHSLAGQWLAGFPFPWDALGGIKDLILSLGPRPGVQFLCNLFPGWDQERESDP